VNLAAVAAEVGKPAVVRQNQDDVRPLFRRRGRSDCQYEDSEARKALPSHGGCDAGTKKHECSISASHKTFSERVRFRFDFLPMHFVEALFRDELAILWQGVLTQGNAPHLARFRSSHPSWVTTVCNPLPQSAMP
jgi:hypothetical protein